MAKKTKLIIGITAGVIIILGGTLLTLDRFGILNLGIFASTVTPSSGYTGNPNEYGYVLPVASSERFLKKYPNGISRSYQITRKDGVKYEANINLKNTDNPANYSFKTGTKVELTAEVALLERPSGEQTYLSGELKFRFYRSNWTGLDRDLSLGGVFRGKPISQGGQYYTKTFSLILPKPSQWDSPPDHYDFYVWHQFRENGRLREVSINGKKSKTPLDGNSAGPYVPAPFLFFPPYYISYNSSVKCPAPASESPAPETVSYTVGSGSQGWDVVIVPGESVDIGASAFYKAGLEIYDFNLNTYGDWHKATIGDHSDLTTLHRRRGYLIKSAYECETTITAKTVNNTQDEKVVIRRGWNLLANSKDKEVKFSEMKFWVLLQNLGGKCNSPNENSQECKAHKECSDKFWICSEEKSMADLFKPDSKLSYAGGTRGWKNVYIYRSPFSNFSFPVDYYFANNSELPPGEVATITQNNLNDVVIPAKSAFWFYLSE